MKTKKSLTNKPTKRLIVIIALAAILVFGGGVFVYAKFINQPATQSETKPINSVDYSTPTTDQQESGESIKDNSVNNESSGDSGSDQPPAPTPQQEGKAVVEIIIPSKNIDPVTKILRVSSQISAKVATGTCTLMLTKAGSATIVKTADSFQAGAQISTCKGFDINTSDMSTGTWNIDLVFENATLYGHVTETVNI